MRSTALGKNQQRDIFLLNCFGGRLHGLNCGPGIFTGNGNVTRAAQVRAQERDLEQTALGQESKLDGDMRECNRSIVITRMVGYEDIAAIGIDLFETFNMHVNAGDCEERAGPGACDANLHAAGVVEERNDEADGAEKDGGQDDGGIGEENTAQFSQGLFYE